MFEQILHIDIKNVYHFAIFPYLLPLLVLRGRFCEFVCLCMCAYFKYWLMLFRQIHISHIIVTKRGPSRTENKNLLETFVWPFFAVTAAALISFIFWPIDGARSTSIHSWKNVVVQPSLQHLQWAFYWINVCSPLSSSRVFALLYNQCNKLLIIVITATLAKTPRS